MSINPISYSTTHTPDLNGPKQTDKPTSTPNLGHQIGPALTLHLTSVGGGQASGDADHDGDSE